MSADVDLQIKLDEIYTIWYEGIDKNDGKNGWGSICGGITIIENLLNNYILDLSYHQTNGGTQLKGAGASLGNRVLRRFNLPGSVTGTEFGRTSRGGPRAAEKLILLLKQLDLESSTLEKRNKMLLYLQERMATALVQLLDRKTEIIHIQASDTFEKIIKNILSVVPKAACGAVAQHLVGAKLQLRFPNIAITNDRSSAADAPTNRFGDFLINTTVFHITMAPQMAVYEKCKWNLQEGLLVYLLVPHTKFDVARKGLENSGIRDQVFLQSIEAFIAQNIEEIAQFSKHGINEQMENLVGIYNQRIKDADERHAPFLSINNNVLIIEEKAE